MGRIFLFCFLGLCDKSIALGIANVSISITSQEKNPKQYLILTVMEVISDTLKDFKNIGMGGSIIFTLNLQVFSLQNSDFSPLFCKECCSISQATEP
jgi:hypothetical protein